jgi:hypothetical protein
MNVKQVAKNKSIIAAIVAMISVLGTAETAYAGPCRTPCSDRVTDWFKTPDGGFRCFDDGYFFTSIYGFQIDVTWDKNGCFLSRETYFIDDRNELTSAIREDGFWDCCGSFPILKTFLGSDGKTVTKVEKFGEDGCLTETDAFVYDDKGQLKDEIISDQYYNYNCLVISPEPTPVAGRVTHKTPAVFVTGPGPVPIPQQKTTEISLYDRDGHLVSVTTFDDQGRAKRSDVHPPFTPSGQSGVPVSSLPNGSGHGQSGQADSLGGVNMGRTQSVSPGSAPATGGTAGVVGTNAAVVRHPGQSFKALKRAHGGAAPTGTGGTAGVASPATGTATGGTAGVAGPSATPSGGGNSASGGTAGVAGGSSGQAGAGNKRKIISQKSSSAATDTLTGGNSATGGTAGVAAGSSGQAGAGNKSKIIWQKSSSAATNTGSSAAGNSATGGTAGVAGPGTTQGSSSSGTNRQKSQSKRSVSASSNANIQGSRQPVGSVHPTPTPSPRKKKPGTDVENEH